MKLTRLNAFEQSLRHLMTAASTARLYTPEHKQVKKLCGMAQKTLQQSLAAEGSISLMRIDEQLAVDEHPLSRSMYIDRFARLLKTHGIGHIKFFKDISADELHSLVCGFSGKEKVSRSTDNMRLGQVEVRYHAPLSPASAVSTENDAHPSDGSRELVEEGLQSNLLIESAQILEEISCEELARIMEVYEAAKNNRRLQVVGLSEIVAGFIDVFAGYADPLLTLVPLRNMDEYTFTHSLNVCLLNLAQATALGIEGQLLHDIGLSAMLHDVGKLFIPEDILKKPDKLDEKEWEQMHQHPIRGAEYLLDNPGVPRMAVINAYEHHLRFDLRGYPHVNDKWQQNLCSQLTSISDIYDSLRTKRPYRDPLELEAVLINIEQLMGTQLHPLLVENFLKLMRKVAAHDESKPSS